MTLVTLIAFGQSFPKLYEIWKLDVVWQMGLPSIEVDTKENTAELKIVYNGNYLVCNHL